MSDSGKRYPLASSVARATLAVALFYIVFTLVALASHSWDPLWFVWVGERFADLDPTGRRGYDGQFVYYIAADGIAALPHLDNPAYRLQRILLPATVRALTILTGLPVAWTLLATNLIAIVITTYLLARWLETQALSPWYVLTYSLYVGVFMAYSRDLTEPLAFCLGAYGLILAHRRRPAGSALALALAALTKEIAIIFAVGLVCAAIIRRDVKSALWSASAAVPLLVWETYLYAHLGQIPFRSGPSLEPLPLGGILPYLTLDPGRLSAFLFTGLPALGVLPLSIWLLYRHRGSLLAPWWTLLYSLFVVLLPLDVYNHIMHAGRNASGMMLALVFTLPLLDKHARRLVLFFAVVPTLIWLIPVLRWAPWI